jgi:hypothetical protein
VVWKIYPLLRKLKNKKGPREGPIFFKEKLLRSQLQMPQGLLIMAGRRQGVTLSIVTGSVPEVEDWDGKPSWDRMFLGRRP